MRTSHKLLALLLSVLLIAGVAVISPVTVFAAKDNSEEVGMEYVTMNVGGTHTFKASAPMNGAITTCGWTVNGYGYLEQISSSNTMPSIMYKALKATTSDIYVTCDFYYLVEGSKLLNHGIVTFKVSINAGSSGGSSGSGGSGGSGGSEIIGNTVLITFDPNGGYVSRRTMYVGWQQIIEEDLPIPTREGYDFEGWYYEKDDWRVTKGCVLIEDTPLKAHWIKRNNSLAVPRITEITSDKKRIYVKWSSVPNAKKYRFAYNSFLDILDEEKSKDDFNYYTVENSTEFSVPKLYERKYVFKVRAGDDNGFGAYSETESLVTLDIPEISVEKSVDGISVKWNKVDYATHYYVFYKSETDKQWYTEKTKNTSFNLQNPDDGKTYYFSVAAYDDRSVFTGPQSDVKEISIPQSPHNIKPNLSLKQNGNEITGTWNGIQSATKYVVYYKKSTDANWSSIETTSTSYTITGVAPETTYYMQILPMFTSVKGKYSNVASVTTAKGISINKAKPSLSVANKSDSLHIQWNTISGADSYTLYYRTASAGSWSSISVTGTSYNYKGTPGTLYYFQIIPKFGSANGTPSNVGSCTYVRNTTLKSTAYNSNGSVTVGWDAAPGANGYAVAKRKSTDSSYTYYYTSSTTFNDKNVVGAAIYYYQIRPYYTNGKSAAYSDWSNSKTITTLFKPTITSMNISASLLNINWNAIKGAKGYKVAFKRATDSAWNYRTTTSRYFNVPNPTQGATYYVQVCAIAGNLASPWSDLKSASLVVLTKPVLEGDTNSSRNYLSWNLVNGAKSYQIAKKTTKQTAYTYLTTTEPSYTDKSFTDGQTYTYQVRAYDGSKYGPWSNVLTLKTLVDTPVINEFEDYGFMLYADWNDIEGADAYQVAYRKTGEREWSYQIVFDSDFYLFEYVANSKYYMQVRTIGENGVCGNWSKEKIVYTD